MAAEGKGHDSLALKREALIRMAQLKYEQACLVPHGHFSCRALELKSPTLTEEDSKAAILRSWWTSAGE